MTCQYPGCDQHEMMEFATVRVCRIHLNKLIKETDEYYNRQRKDRPVYAVIAPMIKHSRRYTKRARPVGE